MGKKIKTATHPVGEWFVRLGRPEWGAGIVRSVDAVGDSKTEFPAGALHDCGGEIRMGFGEWLFDNDTRSRKATKTEITEAKALFDKQGIDWKTGKAKPTKRPARPAAKAKWVPCAPALSIKETKRSLYLKLEEMVATINNLGAENARLKNHLAKLKGQK